MSPSGNPYNNLTVQRIRPISAAAGEHGTSPGFPLPLYGALIFAGVLVLSLVTTAFLLPRGKFSELHCSLLQLITSWDSGRYLIIAVHGYPRDSNLLWFPGYPAAIHAIAWIPGISPVGAGLSVTIAAGLAAAWGLTRLGMTLTARNPLFSFTASDAAVARERLALAIASLCAFAAVRSSALVIGSALAIFPVL